MGEKIWIAEKNYDYEGSTFLGAFSSVEKGIVSCEKDRVKYGRENDLDFHKLENANTYISEHGAINYCVFETEIDSENVDKD